MDKVIIEVEGGKQIAVCFYPNRYSLNKSNQIAEIGIPGLGSPILQYVRGNTRTLSMELFFDTYEEGSDVRTYTDQIYHLLGIKADKHVPPICTITWGELNFRCVLQQVNGNFTLFLDDGTPVRATLNVTFKEYIDVAIEVRKAPLESSDHTKRHIVKRGDTLSSIAALEYEDPARWRPIAQANGITNPRRLQPGRTLIIPPLP